MTRPAIDRGLIPTNHSDACVKMIFTKWTLIGIKHPDTDTHSDHGGSGRHR